MGRTLHKPGSPRITPLEWSGTLTAIVALDPEAVLDVLGITANSGVYAEYLTDHLGSTRKVVATPDPPNPPTITFSAEYARYHLRTLEERRLAVTQRVGLSTQVFRVAGAEPKADT